MIQIKCKGRWHEINRQFALYGIAVVEHVNTEGPYHTVWVKATRSNAEKLADWKLAQDCRSISVTFAFILDYEGEPVER